ncbi:hypothetical protein C2845_PM07G09040 [Panicum miliaceum]|uniref:Uncharacterized protein n=1 Tax=Panicum miliaceum TaxID=4540 RepID=A0A3L6SQJ9_PANMI|nr:hypothetical protein C2845_PM07G09040 [Panicum miliaceum]
MGRAFEESTASGGWGFIIRDHHGDAVAAGAGNLQHVADPAHACRGRGLLASRQALNFASGAGLE